MLLLTTFSTPRNLWEERFLGVLKVVKKRTYFETVSNQEEYFRDHENICFMVFLNNMSMTLSHTVFNTPLDLISGQCYPFQSKIASSC